MSKDKNKKIEKGMEKEEVDMAVDLFARLFLDHIIWNAKQEKRKKETKKNKDQEDKG